MQLKNYAAKNQLQVSDVIEVLASKFTKTVWQPSTELKPTHLDLLEVTFGTSQPQLPSSQPQPQLPQGQVNTIATIKKSSDLATTLNDKKDGLATPDLEVLKAEIKTTVIRETAQIAAIQDYQTFNDTYEQTTRDLVVNEVTSHLERQVNIREQFKASQLLRKQTLAKPERKDLTTELLEVWGNDHDDFVSNLLKNI